MKLKLILIMIIYCSLFNVRASNNDAISKKLNEQDKQYLRWIDTNNGQILFTSDDIISFNWEKQIFLLKMDATIDFFTWMASHKSLYRKLVVKDNNGVIYEGQYVSGLSSMGFTGPVYSWTNPFFTIKNGYPSRFSKNNREDDPRYNERIKNVLEKTGKLSIIDPNKKYFGTTIDIIRQLQSWYDCGEDLKVRVEYIRNTFIYDGEPRINVYFAGGEKVLKKINDISLEIKFTSDFGRYRSDVNIVNISSKIISDGIYVCKFKPWIPKPAH